MSLQVQYSFEKKYYSHECVQFITVQIMHQMKANIPPHCILS